MKSLVLKSHAKVNLYLAVLGKRADNYHTIRTVFERVSLHDVIRISCRRDGRVTARCTDASVPVDERNLCVRAALMLKRLCAVSEGADIAIRKAIPVGAGMGGGSSNAAAALLGLNRLWKLKLPLRRLTALGRRIGADVPFFLYDTPYARGTARGDVIRPLDVPASRRFWHVIVVPRIHVSTPYIYNAWDGFSGLTRPFSDVKLISSITRKEGFPFSAGTLFNGLQEVTVSLYPDVRRCIAALEENGAGGVMMSGSGPSVFGFARSRADAARIARAIKAAKPDWRVFSVRTA